VDTIGGFNEVIAWMFTYNQIILCVELKAISAHR
jgi:hypothetical protein